MAATGCSLYYLLPGWNLGVIQVQFSLLGVSQVSLKGEVEGLGTVEHSYQSLGEKSALGRLNRTINI